jgi:hypothetical protein
MGTQGNLPSQGRRRELKINLQSPIFNLIVVLLFLLLGFALRVYRLGEVPPGLTHDEANHGWDAINILEGVWRFYFPLNYGSEPLYNYVVAGLMAGIGRHLFALRLVNVYCGLLALAATYRLGRMLFGRWPAVTAAALMAVCFWPLATSRQGLRAGILPLLMVGAGIFFWKIVGVGLGKKGNLPSQGRGQELALGGPRAGTCPDKVGGGNSRGRGGPHGWEETRIEEVVGLRRENLFYFLPGFILCVVATLHTYLAARVLWLLFPLFLLYLALWHRPLFWQSWRPVLLGLVAAGLLTVPMFLYLRTHPEADTRLEMLDRPLAALQQGDFRPIVENATNGLLAFVWPGYGDHFLAYNIPGRPVYDGATTLYFLLGLLVCLWRWRRPAYFFLLLWFGIGILPSLVTGPEANTTRNLGALGAVYLLPVVGVYSVLRIPYFVLKRGTKRNTQYIIGVVTTLWLVTSAFLSLRDYFGRWANDPDVPAAYQHTLVQGLSSLAEQTAVGEAAVVSSVYPGAAHDPSIARVMGQQQELDLRWIDARSALIFPGGTAATLLLPASTPLHPAFQEWVQPGEVIALRPDDLDPSYQLARLVAGQWPVAAERVNFGNALELIGWQWSLEPVTEGGTADLLTVWRVLDPTLVGPVVPPAYTTDVVFFTHLLDEDGTIAAQRDALDAPSWSWQVGDVVVQVHTFVVQLQPGLYETAVGVYDRASGARLPMIGADGEAGDGSALVAPLMVAAP